MNDPLDAFLANYPDEIHQLALKLRDLILKELPAMIEQVDAPSKIIGYGYNRTYKGLVCGIAPFQSHLNLMFSKGATLPDAEGLLEGTGKKARHVKIRTAEDIARRSCIAGSSGGSNQGGFRTFLITKFMK